MSENLAVRPDNKRSVITLVLAFAAVYIIWGSTYLAIKFAIETLPTFLMAGVRFVVAGSILLTIARLSPGYTRPKPIHWRTSLIVGTLLLTVGNGGVVLAEHYISSSLAALLVATMPFWMVLLSWAFMGSGRPNIKVVAGLMLGFLGVWLLIAGREADSGQSTSGQLVGVALIMIATLGWAIGSLYGTRAPSVESPILAAGMQMLSGGLLLLVIGTLDGEWVTVDLAAVSANSWLALGYLIIFGAVVAYTAYSWLMKNVSPAAISTYAYVNPAIAVVLGWAIAGESLTSQMLIGAGVIVASVALITLNKNSKTEESIKEIEVAKIQRTDQPGFSTSG